MAEAGILMQMFPQAQLHLTCFGSVVESFWRMPWGQIYAKQRPVQYIYIYISLALRIKY